jgi:hypothetical protein
MILIYWVKKHINSFRRGSEEVHLEINVVKNTCVFMSRRLNVGQIHDVTIASKTLKPVAKLKQDSTKRLYSSGDKAYICG